MEKMETDLDGLDRTIREVTSGVMLETPPPLLPIALNGIMLTPRIAALMLSMTATIRERDQEIAKLQGKKK